MTQFKIPNLYQYKAHVKKIYDGDTITNLTIDLGFGHLMTEEYIRLFGINTFELRDSKYHKRTEDEKLKAEQAKQLMLDCCLNRDIIIRTYPTSKYKPKDKKGKYGRYLADVFIPLEWLEKSVSGLSYCPDFSILLPKLKLVDNINSDITYVNVNQAMVEMELALVALYK